MRTTRTTSRTVLLKPCNLAETKRAVTDGINNIIWQYTLHNWNQAIQVMLMENGVKKQEHLKLKTWFKLGTCKPTSPSTSSPCSARGGVSGVNRNSQVNRVYAFCLSENKNHH